MSKPLSNQTPEITILDGPLGTQLHARGVPTTLPLWSAAAVRTAPNTLAEIHRDYAEAGATVHTTNTFRTRRRNAGPDWESWTSEAISIARDAVGKTHRIAGSLAPLEDCYRPDLAPIDASQEHEELAFELANGGCDLILCETFASHTEAIQAVQAGIQTGLPTWLAMTAGPSSDLMTPESMVATAIQAVDLGVSAVLVNCTPAKDSLRYIRSLIAQGFEIPIGCYANAGQPCDQMGWESANRPAADRYAAFAQRWIDAGATILGGCCGTTPQHIARLSSMRDPPRV